MVNFTAVVVWFGVFLLSLGFFSHVPDMTLAENMTGTSIEMFQLFVAFISVSSLIFLVKAVADK